MIDELFDQLTKAWNFETPTEILGPISEEAASRRIPGAPYTVLENLAHTLVWQRYLLSGPEAKLPDHEQEWPVPEPGEWDALRDEFIAGWERSAELAASNPDEATTTKLLHVALHGAYHLGQIALMRRILES